MGRQRQGRLLATLLVLFVVLLGYPAVLLVEALQQSTTKALLPLWIFGVWGLVILCAALIVERPGARR
jgi:ABC-type thiamin/hydroxymethylpyrimidine transport system permease subunit